MVLLMVTPYLCFSQYFQRLYDYDSSCDWGVNIFLQPDGNYFIRGNLQHTASEDWAIFNMQISADGNTVLSKHVVQIDTTSMFLGTPGETRCLLGGGYIAPIQILQPHGSYPSGRGGLIKYDAAGDTVFLKTYTDTSQYFEGMYACAVMPDEGYIGGGGRSYDTFSYFDPLLLVRTDSMGDTLWTRTYQKNDTQASAINNLISLADGRIVAGAMSTKVVGVPSGSYYDNAPWFILLDNMGNIIRDTLYSSTYLVGENCGSLYADINGGYTHIGILNSYNPADINAISNFPAYIAHLDTNFRMTWITNFTYNSTYGHRQGDIVRQLQDSSYVVVGEATGPYAPSTQGFAAKISKTGAIVWSNNYYSDSNQFAYFVDMVEKPDGGLVFVGKTFNDTCAAWKDNGDVWLVSTDSNGYIPPNTGVTVSPVVAEGVVKIYPNPTSGNFTISTSASLTGGEVLVYNVAGLYVATYKVKPGANNFQLPAGIGAGIYICKYIPGDGNDVPAVVRLVYAP